MKNDLEPTAAKKPHLATHVMWMTSLYTKTLPRWWISGNQVTDQSAHQLVVPHHSWGADDSFPGEVDNNAANLLTSISNTILVMATQFNIEAGKSSLNVNDTGNVTHGE